MLRPLVLLFATTLAMTQGVQANSGSTLTIDVNEIDVSKGGKLVVMIYDNEDSWLNIKQRRHQKILDITGPTMKVEFGGLTYGNYAVSAVQDLNGNNKVDMGWFPTPHPIEAQGTSNNIRPRFGPPSYEDAQFMLGAVPKQISINLTL